MIVDPAGTTTDPDKLRARCQDLEAAFLAQFLKDVEPAPSESFSGGVGEEQFSSLQSDELAKGIVRAGGIGLAERLFAALSERGQ